MPDTIMTRNGTGYKVPGWYPLPGSTLSGSFSEEYHRRFWEFWAMDDDEIRSEVDRLRTLHASEGNQYTITIRAQTYAAEDVLSRRSHGKVTLSSAYPQESKYVRRSTSRKDD